jgi:hypothetical protein
LNDRETTANDQEQAMTADTCIVLPEPIRRRGAELLHLQCWLWGCDIRRAEGNLLLAYGFSRQRPPSGAAGSSAYLMALESGVCVVLWGFGAFYGNPAEGGVYLRRYEFTPVRTAPLNAQRLPWLPDRIRPADIPPEPDVRQRMHRQFVALLEWIAQYEMWVRNTYGLAYRRRCAEESTKHTFRIAIEQLVEEWQHLAHRCADLS